MTTKVDSLTTRLTEVLARLTGADRGRLVAALAEDGDAARVARHAALAQRKADALARHEERIRALLADVAAREEREAACAAALREAEGWAAEGRHALARERLAADTEIALLDHDLRATADPAIDAFVVEVRESLARVRQAGIPAATVRDTGQYSRATGRPVTEVWSVESAVHDHARVLVAALAAAEELRVDPAADVPRALAGLRHGLQTAARYTAVRVDGAAA